MAARKPSAENITEQLRAWSGGNATEASDAVLNLVYDELHRQAQRYLRRERAGHTLQTTALVHEVYLKLVKQENIAWESRSHFFGIAAKLMREILIDYARTKHRAKRGGANDKVPLENALTVGVSDIDFDLLALDEALERLAKHDAPSAELVKLRYFAGLTIPQAAEILGVSPRKADFIWSILAEARLSPSANRV